jgi:hypothetical protein
VRGFGPFSRPGNDISQTRGLAHVLKAIVPRARHCDQIRRLPANLGGDRPSDAINATTALTLIDP